jgi:MoxR-like ATPase
MEAVQQFVSQLRDQVSTVVVGQDDMLNQCLLGLLCKGHVLLEGVPGIAKTLTVKTLARVLRLKFQRLPIFTDLLLVDEVNRMPPRTQAALLESMEEQQVTIDGARYPLSEFFTVFATQNPVEFEGTYPLPEAQLDRFLLKIRVRYPTAEEELRLLTKFKHGPDSRNLAEGQLHALEPELLNRAREEVRTGVRVEENLFSYILAVGRQTREWPSLSLGASPRAVISILTTAKAAAAMDGRDYIIPDDVKTVALPVLRHRILLKPEAELEGLTPDHILSDVLRAVEIPK